ncbi:MAG TPA: GntR family transcriptional regulator [Verrucomicrobiae bacterium]|nr:GntR family transcriptional regulator [Verrucomicrobiae bacterium]
MITFRLNTHSGVPPYLQIVQQVRQALQVGILQPGDQLPTVKEVVAHIAINPNTVAKAYRELESLGITEGRTGSGTFVKQRPAGPSPAIQEALSQDLEGWIAKARQAGLDEEGIEALVRVTLHKK